MRKKEKKELKGHLDCGRFVSMKDCYYECAYYNACRLVYVEWRNKNARKKNS